MTDSIQKVLAEMRDIGDSATWPAEAHKWADRIESLMNAEPVAWAVRWEGSTDIDPEFVGTTEEEARGYIDPDAGVYSIIPLYAAPQPSEDCAALREALEDVEYFLGQIDPVHWPSRSEAREAIGVVREALSSTAGRGYAERLRKAEAALAEANDSLTYFEEWSYSLAELVPNPEDYDNDLFSQEGAITQWLKDTLERLRKAEEERDEYLDIIAACRDAAGFGSASDPMNGYGVAALGGPSEVPAFINDQLRRLRAELERYKADGWQLVPVEPTEAMLIAMREDHYANSGCQFGRDDYASAYRAMLKAAKGDG